MTPRVFRETSLLCEPSWTKCREQACVGLRPNQGSGFARVAPAGHNSRPQATCHTCASVQGRAAGGAGAPTRCLLLPCRRPTPRLTHNKQRLHLCPGTACERVAMMLQGCGAAGAAPCSSICGTRKAHAASAADPRWASGWLRHLAQHFQRLRLEEGGRGRQRHALAPRPQLLSFGHGDRRPAGNGGGARQQ